MTKHETWQLKQRQALPLEAKIKMTKARIEEWYEHWDGMVYVAFSGGKDSTVLKHIVDSMYDDVPSVFVDTGLEYPEIKEFVKQSKNTEIICPQMSFKEVIKTYGYPLISKEVAHKIKTARKTPNGFVAEFFDENTERSKRYNGKYCVARWKFLKDADWIPIGRDCCDVMKKRPSHRYAKDTGRMPIVATMASESMMRRTQWLKHGCNAFDIAEPQSKPMSFWTEQDVLLYLKRFSVPYASVYGDIVGDFGEDEFDGQTTLFDDSEIKLKTTGCSRTGCVFCGFGCHLEKTPNRFQRLKETHPQLYNYCINGGEYVDGVWQPSKEGLGMGKILDFLGVDY